MPKFKTSYSAMPRVQFETVGPSLTRQESKQECDINRIMQRFEKTGVLEHRNRFEGAYGDFIDAPQSYHEAVNSVLEAQDMFMSLPAKVRKRFGNDPAEFVDFVGDPSNREEMAKMGLLKPVPASDVVEPTPKPKAPPEAPKTASEAPPRKIVAQYPS